MSHRGQFLSIDEDHRLPSCSGTESFFFVSEMLSLWKIEKKYTKPATTKHHGLGWSWFKPSENKGTWEQDWRKIFLQTTGPERIYRYSLGVGRCDIEKPPFNTTKVKLRSPSPKITPVEPTRHVGAFSQDSEEYETNDFDLYIQTGT
jgi:hypothetical protein